MGITSVRCYTHVVTVSFVHTGVSEVLQRLVPIIQEVLVREGAVEKSLDAAQGLRTQQVGVLFWT